MPAPSTPSFALRGRVVTMDATFSVLDAGAVYVDNGPIVAVTEVGSPVRECGDILRLLTMFSAEVMQDRVGFLGAWIRSE